MVKITIELDEQTHTNLKKRANLNLRSMRNELAVIVQTTLNSDSTTRNNYTMYSKKID